MEEANAHIVYVIQRWVAEHGYDYWTDTIATPATGMFIVPQYGFADLVEAENRISKVRALYPNEKYRLINRTTTETVIA